MASTGAERRKGEIAVRPNKLTDARLHDSEGEECPFAEPWEGYKDVIAPRVQNKAIGD